MEILMLNSQTLTDYITHHCTQSLGKALTAERHPSWKRHCPELTDSDFIRLDLTRCISAVDSGIRRAVGGAIGTMQIGTIHNGFWNHNM